ncbi:MAG TPA: c-type cytochrome [Noviherbaspirillum sp.]|nr:c-type cytochrome [Noviherbaspirillum sp.]
MIPRCVLCLLLLLPAAVIGESIQKPRVDGDPDRGKAAVERYGCVACHAIPGTANQGSNVGPPLHKIARRAYLGGVIPNTPQNMVRWLRNPPQAAPRTAMPNLGMSEQEATDIASYLYSLD